MERQDYFPAMAGTEEETRLNIWRGASPSQKPEALEEAMRNPPKNTRAALRVSTAKKLGPKVKSCNWGGLTIKSKAGDKYMSLRSLN